MFERIYINGDSYSALSPKNKVYSDFLQERFPEAEVINRAIEGCNNDRIFRSTVEWLNDAGPNTLAILGFSFFSRQEVWYNGNKKHVINFCTKQNSKDYPGSEKLFDTLRLITLDTILKLDPNDYYKQRSIDINYTKVLIDYCTHLLTLTGWMENKKIKYFIFSAAENTDWQSCNRDFIKSLSVFNAVINHPHIYKFFEFNMRQFAQENKLTTENSYHLFEDGHEKFAKFLIKKCLKVKEIKS